MSWFFRIVGLILAVFFGLCVVGFFIGETKTELTSVTIPADPSDIYDMIVDLQTYPAWSGLAGAQADWVFGGSDAGAGGTAAWKQGQRFGSLQLLQAVEDEYVVLESNGPLGVQTVTLAVDDSGRNDAIYATDVILSAERETSGFPFIGRLSEFSRSSKTQAALTQAASGLASQFENGAPRN